MDWKCSIGYCTYTGRSVLSTIHCEQIIGAMNLAWYNTTVAFYAVLHVNVKCCRGLIGNLTTNFYNTLPTYVHAKALEMSSPCFIVHKSHLYHCYLYSYMCKSYYRPFHILFPVLFLSIKSFTSFIPNQTNACKTCILIWFLEMSDFFTLFNTPVSDTCCCSQRSFPLPFYENL